MAWQTDMVLLLRSFVSDMVSPYTYTDQRLQDVIVSAAVPVINEIDFANSYTIDIAASGIDPDPVDSTKEIAFQVLTCRRAAQMVYSGEFREASNKAINFRDGPSQIDTRGIAESKKALFDSAAGEYERARIAYLTGDGMHGKGIVTPFNIGGITNIPGSSKTISSPQRSIYGNWS